jgi:cell division protein FtsL
MSIIPWVIAAILALAVILLSLTLFRLKRQARELEERILQLTTAVRPEDVELMSDKERRERIADILSDALIEWLKENRREKLEEKEEKELKEHLSKHTEERE